MAPTEYAKRDLVVVYDGRTFALRAYRDDTIAAGPQWQSLIIEQRTPLPYAAPCELACADAEEAAAIGGHDLAGAPGATVVIQHLAAWRQDPPPAVSPLPLATRQQLLAFFAALARASEAAETVFRGRVAALLMPPALEPGRADVDPTPARTDHAARRERPPAERTHGPTHSSRDQSADR